MDSFRGYDDWRCCPPEDERGYWTNRPPEGPSSAEMQAEAMITAGTKAARILADIPGATISFGASVPVDTVRAVARLMKRPVRAHLFEGERTIEVADFFVDGVEIRLQGHRPATAAEIAAGASK